MNELTSKMTETLTNLKDIIAHLRDPERNKLVTAATELAEAAVNLLKIAKEQRDDLKAQKSALDNLASARKEVLECLGDTKTADEGETNVTLEACRNVAKSVGDLIHKYYKEVARGCVDGETQHEVTMSWSEDNSFQSSTYNTDKKSGIISSRLLMMF